MAMLRFKLGTWNKGLVINGKDEKTGFLVVESNGEVTCKNLFRTKFLFVLTDITKFEHQGKDMKLFVSNGDEIELRANADDLESLGRLLKIKKQEPA